MGYTTTMKRIWLGLALMGCLSGCTVPAGECAAGPCPMMCLRNVTCVTACGGPATECGCCACAEGSIDTLSCD
jgi:hypothetical protein